MGGDADLEDRSLIRRLWWLWIPVALLILVVLVYALTRTSLLDVDRIEVEGAGPRVTEWTVREVAGIEVGQPLFDLDLGAVDGRLTALPWVAEATVDREWSGTVRLRILERTPVVVAVNPVGAQVLLDAVGAVLDAVDPGAPVDPTLPHVRIDGFGPPGSRVSGYRATVARCRGHTTGPGCVDRRSGADRGRYPCGSGWGRSGATGLQRRLPGSGPVPRHGAHPGHVGLPPGGGRLDSRQSGGPARRLLKALLSPVPGPVLSWGSTSGTGALRKTFPIGLTSDDYST